MLKRSLLFIVLFLLLAACAENAIDTPTQTATATILPDATPTPFATSTAAPPTPTSNATPPIPHIDVDNQILADEGQVMIASIMSSQPGWAVVYAFQNDELGEILGATAVQTGINTQVNVTINPLDATPTLAVVLHVDEGTPTVFEYPNGADVPLRFETGIIAQTFTPQFELSLPVITMKDQEILEDGLLHVDKVVALTPGWLVIHADEDGELGEYLGATPLTAGANENLTVHIPWQQGTSTLHAVIYADNGRAQQLDPPDIDTPFLVNGDPVVASFRVTYPPDLFVLDQPIIDGKFEVERATSNGPGWLVVYYDDDGQQGLIIGYEALQDGVNEHIEVEVLHTAVTNPLYIRLHEDSEPGDAFDFPRVDPPVVYQGRQLLPYSFNTEPGAYLATRDQIPEEGGDGELQVTIPYAIVDGPSWVVVQAEVNGVLGEILGMAQLQAGLNRDVVVKLDPSKVTEHVQAALYIDAGEAGIFEYPNGADTPIQRNRRTLSSPFMLLNFGAEPLSPAEE